MKWLESLLDLGYISGTLESSDLPLIRACFHTRGNRKGKVKKHMEQDDKQPGLYEAWLAVMSTLRTLKQIEIGYLMIYPENRGVFKRIDNWTRLKSVAQGINAFGQGILEFNMNHWDYPLPTTQEQFSQAIDRALDIFMAKKAYA